MSNIRQCIEPMLVLSTGHLPEETVRKVSARELKISRMIPHDYGFILYVPEESEGFHEEDEPLENIIRVARQHNIVWLNFDRDAEVIDDLPTFEW